jgi:hypothetical protein
MTENQTKSSPKDVPLVPLFHTILAAENKTSELFVKSFQYQGENISTKHLGQIFGFFEIPDTQEDNAYIVNFLASVVKKEYFINPKRSATDSFEAALHKINLALTELVKQGNTGWLGKLNGVVSVIENNRFHFSVTGDASILLYRDNQVNLISDGLADKDAALHPLKTFLEISSGALLPQDKILITSPELFTLCHPETLRKNAFRMDKNGFARYVRAALVNELPLGVSTIIDLDPAPKPARPKKKATVLREESLEKLQNVFSSAPFVDTPKSNPVSIEEDLDILEEEIAPSEYTDKKTGHIYLQGEDHSHDYQEPSGWQTFLDENLRPASASIALGLKRLTKKSRKSVAKQAAILGAGGKELSLSLWQLSKEKGAEAATKSSKNIKSKLESLKTKRSQAENFSAYEAREADQASESVTIEMPEELVETQSVPSQRLQTLKRFSPRYQPREEGSQANSLSLLTPATGKLRSSVHIFEKYNRLLSGKQKLLIALVAAGGIVLTVALINHDSTPVAEENMNTPVQTPAPTEAAPAVPQLGSAQELASWQEGVSLLVVATDESTIVVTPKSVIANNKALPFVANGTIESATYMPDLKMIFLWSSANELVSWSLVDQKFTANIFPLPAGADVSNLGAYLTYLYALDDKTGTIYRFARTEGGFGEPTSWLKTPLPKSSVQAFVVNDTIRIAATAATDQYLRGTKEKTLSETSYQVLGSTSAQTFTLGVETTEGKLTVWDTDGNPVHEATYPELTGISAVTYNESTKKLLVTKDQKLIGYNLSW